MKAPLTTQVYCIHL